MGRASRAKKERREARARPAGRLLDFERASVLRLLTAASISPTSTHRQPTISLATISVLQQRIPGGSLVATAADLPEILEAASPPATVASLEVDEPLDPAMAVRVRWGSELFHIAPGQWERPISIVEDAHALCVLADEDLRGCLGFGPSDLVELCLRHMDGAIRACLPVWHQHCFTSPFKQRSGWGVPPASVTQAEVDALAGAPTLHDSVASCSDPNAARTALRWASCHPKDLRAGLGEQTGIFGPVLAVRSGASVEAVPVGFFLDALYSALERLRAVAYEIEGVRKRACHHAELRTLELISAFGPLAERPAVGDDQITALQHVRDGLLLAVDAVAHTSPADSMHAAETRLRSFRPGATVGTEGGSIHINEADRVVRLVVVVTPESVVGFGGPEDDPPVSVLPIEDLRWILTTSERVDDLALFLDDWQVGPGARMFSFGAFDLWELWKGNGGAFHRRGAPLTLLMVAPHHERAEWERHHTFRWLDRALCDLGLKGLPRWLKVVTETGSERSATVIDVSRRTAVDVSMPNDGATSIGVRYNPVDDAEVPAAAIAHAIAWRLRHAGETSLGLVAAGMSKSVRVEVRRALDAAAGALAVTTNGDVVIVQISDEIGDLLIEDSLAVELRIGALIAAASLSSDTDRETFTAAWAASSPGIVVDQSSVPQQAGDLPDFVEPHGSIRAAVERDLAARLLDAGIRSGVRRGKAARDLESGTIYRHLKEMLAEALSPFDPYYLLRAVAADLERGFAQRWRSEGHMARLASVPTGNVNVPERVVASRRDGTIARRSLSLVVEEVLRTPPAGAASPRFVDCQRIYAIAYLMFESGVRSETIHQGLAGSELEITEGFELIARQGGPIDFDQESFNLARVLVNMPERHSVTEEPAEVSGDDEDSLLDVLPELSEIDSSLRAGLGFGVDTLFGVLDTTITWPVGTTEALGEVSLCELLDAVAFETGCPTDEVEAAVRWLTLRSEDLQGEDLEHWEVDRRAVRLATRPLIETPQGGLILCPWSTGSTRTILGGHLLDGRLPWPRSVLPEVLNDSLDRYRRERNRSLEHDVVAALSNRDHLLVKRSVKKAKVLGLPALPRELDAICVDAQRSRIWVIEAKDRSIAFSPHQIRTAIDEFVRGGGYLDRIAQNVGIIAAGAASVAAALGAAEPERSWEVIGLMVTRRVEPAAFTAGPTIRFCTADTVAETVDRDVLPGPTYAVAMEAAA